MINWKSASILTCALSGIYSGILFLLNGNISFIQLLAICIVTILFLLVNLIQFTGKNNSPENRVQRFMIGTSVQMIVALFTLLIIRYTFKEFKEFVIYFMILFGIQLAIQATLLIVLARKK